MKNNILRNTLLATIAVLLILPSSSFAKSKPDWVDGESKKYPSPRYFIGVGAVPFDKGGKKQQMGWAGDRARAEIAKSLRTNVQVTTRAERNVEGKKGVSKQQDVVTASANEVLEGVEIKEYYRDKKERMLYALAVLDRVKSAKRLEDKTTKIKAEMIEELDEAGRLQNDNRLLPSISHYQRAVALIDEVRQLEDLIAILKPVAFTSDPEMPSRAASIKKIIYELRRKIRFAVSIEGPAAKVQGYLIQGLAKAGYMISGKAAGASAHTYDLKGTTDLTYRGTINMGEGLDMQIFQADLDLEVMDPANDETLGTLTWSTSANEKTEAMAEKSAVRALGRYVQDNIAERLANIL
ncbi:MAG: LPP20 family lipoprotein [Pseudomonadota bacterium]